MNGLRSHIKNSKECFIKYLNTSKSVKKTRPRLVFSTHFSGFGYPNETLFLVFDILHEQHSDRLTAVSLPQYRSEKANKRPSPAAWERAPRGCVLTTLTSGSPHARQVSTQQAIFALARVFSVLSTIPE